MVERWGEVVLDFSFDDMLTIGEGTIVGKVMLSHLTESRRNGVVAALPLIVRLSFQQTTMDWKRNHGHAMTLSLPEHALPCLARDILWLLGNGIKVEVYEMPEDPA